MSENGMEQDLGLAMLGIGSSFGIFSALNTSPVGTVSFAKDNPDVAYKGMNTSLILILAMAAGIGLYYKEKGYLAALATGGIGVGMWVWYDRLIKSYSSGLQVQEGALQITGFPLLIQA